MIATDGRVAEFVGRTIDSHIFPPFTCMGIERRGKIVAGVVFNCFTGPDVEVTVAGHGWTRDFLREVGRYVFDQLGCVRAQITTDQEQVARLAERLGGMREGILRNKYGKGRDGIVIGVLEQEYRYR